MDDDLGFVFPAFIVAARMSAAAFNWASVMLLKLLRSMSDREEWMTKKGSFQILNKSASMIFMFCLRCCVFVL